MWGKGLGCSFFAWVGEAPAFHRELQGDHQCTVCCSLVSLSAIQSWNFHIVINLLLQLKIRSVALIRLTCSAAWHRTAFWIALLWGLLTVAWIGVGAGGICDDWLIGWLISLQNHRQFTAYFDSIKFCVLLFVFCRDEQVGLPSQSWSEAAGVEVLCSLESMSYSFWDQDQNLMLDFLMSSVTWSLGFAWMMSHRICFLSLNGFWEKLDVCLLSDIATWKNCETIRV